MGVSHKLGENLTTYPKANRSQLYSTSKGKTWERQKGCALTWEMESKKKGRAED